MAEGRTRTDQILVFHRGRRHLTARIGKARQASLDHRTRLPRTETRTGTGALRRTRLARLSSSRYVMHRRLRLLSCGTKPFFPLGTSRSTGTTHRENSVRIPAPWLVAFALNVTIRIPSPHYEFSWPGSFFRNSPAARFVVEGGCDISNTVVLVLGLPRAVA